MTLLAFAGNAIQLVPDGTLLFHLALVVVMVVVLNATLLKPINRILEERERRTKGRLSEAQTVLAQVGEKLGEYENRLREARAGGYVLLEQERSAATREHERKIAEVKTELASWLEDEKQGLQVHQEEARASLGVEARKRASEISGQILGRSVSQ